MFGYGTALMYLFICPVLPLAPNELSDMEDSFIKGETEYIIVNIHVTWNEAQIICESYKNGSMAIVNAPDIRDFLGEALSETNLDMEDLWIGARTKRGYNGYPWINNAGAYLPDSFFIHRGQESFTNISRDCLAFSRQFHETPQFINLECKLKRAMICERPYEKTKNGSMTTPDWIIIGHYKYGIFFDRKTWKQAVRDCRKKHNAHLASFRNINEVKIVGKFELIGRPSLENAWIGGHFKHGYWRFISDDVPLPEIPNNETNYPPWRTDRLLKHSGCLLLDRHMAKQPIFLEARCERRRSFICTKENRNLPDYSVIIINKVGYIMYYLKKTWEDAWQQCRKHEAHLVKVTREIIHDITYIMGENVTEVQHIWIGGKLNTEGSIFYWVRDNEPISPNNKDVNHYPPWYDNIYDLRFACLNMDRENHNRPMFYGVACDVPQRFICEQHDLSKLPPVDRSAFIRMKTRTQRIIN